MPGHDLWRSEKVVGEMKSLPQGWLRRLEDFRHALATLDIDRPPEALLLAGAIPAQSRLAVLSGSFNPPTRAHLHLAQTAISAGIAERLLFLVTKQTIDKERMIGAPYAERLLMLSLIVDTDSRFSLLLANRGLYVEQAEAIRALLDPAELLFVVGFDKVVQIFDPRYYHDREAALQRLFSLAKLVVAPRAPAGPAGLTALLERPENAPYRHAVFPLQGGTLDPADAQISATQVRERLARGEPIDGLVPDVILPVLTRSSSYRSCAT